MKNRIWKSFLAVAGIATLVVSGFSAYIVAHYLYTSPRFAVRSVLVPELNRVEDTHVYNKAALPDSVNIFSVDLDAVRERVEGLKWVQFATVQRVLPDTISIRIVERTPVGLALIEGEVFQFDAQAQLLNRDRGVGAVFPILEGLTTEDLELNRKKVDLYLRIMEELNGKDSLSEIHINDDMEVSVVSQDEPILVNLGSERFSERWGLFLQLRMKIRTEHPDTVQVDFRFKGQAILKSKTDPPEETKVVWGAEKKSL